MTTQAQNTSLFMIIDVNVEQSTLTLTNFIYDEQVTLEIPKREAELYEEWFSEALDSNIYLFVQFDKENRKVLRENR